MIKVSKDIIIKSSVFIFLPVVLTLLVFFIYRQYLFDSEFINKKLLKKDMEFKYFIYDEFDSTKGKGDLGDTYYRNGKTYLNDSGKNHFNRDTIKLLDKARDIIQMNWNKDNPSKKIVFNINSAYRTDIRNKEVGGVKNSAHRDKGTGAKAVDISWSKYSKEQKLAILDALRRVGFNRIGKANSFVHADNDSTLPNPAEWTYSGYNNIV